MRKRAIMAIFYIVGLPGMLSLISENKSDAWAIGLGFAIVLIALDSIEQILIQIRDKGRGDQ